MPTATTLSRPVPAKAAAARTASAPATAPRSTAAATATRPPALRLTPGRPLSPPVRAQLEEAFGADLGAVRVHDDAAAAAAAKAMGARAFAVGPDIVLGAGANSDDIELIGHEVAHTIQQSAARQLQRYGDGSGGGLESEARSAGAAAASGGRYEVTGRTDGTRVQGLFGLGSPLDYIADKANYIPGFRMFTILLGVNPINWSAVERTPANVLRALIEFLPAGGLITQALDNHKVFERVGAWVDEQVQTLGLSGAAIKKAVTDFIRSLGASDLLDLSGAWERAKRIFTEPIAKILTFAKNLIGGVLKLVKEAILKPLAKLAEGTAGYDLLKGVLGRDPITGEPHARTAENLLGPCLRLIGQGEMWENMKKANAIPRAWAWFQGALGGLLGYVRQIPALFVTAFQSLELLDIVLLPRALLKVAIVFGGFYLKYLTWVGETFWTLLEIVFDVVSPGLFAYLRKTGTALRSILRNPVPFAGNLVKAAKLGFQNFSANFVEHLKGGLIDWLVGSLPGVYIPKAFELGEVVKFVFSVLGLTWQQIRKKLVDAAGEPAVTAMETGVDIVVTLVRDGPAAAWEKIKDELSGLKLTVIGGIIDFVVDTVVSKAIPRLISYFIPGPGFISAILAIFDVIMVFVNKLAKMFEVVKAFVDAIVAIAGGAIGTAADRVEKALAGFLALAINFLAGIAGLGKVSTKIMKVVDKVRAAIDKALDKLIAIIVQTAKKLWGKAKSAVSAWWKATKEFAAESGEKHTLLLQGEGAAAKLIIRSDPIPYQEFVANLVEPKSAKGKKAEALAIAVLIDAAIAKAPKNAAQDDEALKPVDLKNNPTKTMADLLDRLAAATAPLLAVSGTTSSPAVFGPLRNGFGTSCQVASLTGNHIDGSEPSVDGGPWEVLRRRMLGNGTYYVRGHLLNHNLGGTGGSWQNLTPLTQNSNNRAMESMLTKFERPVKTWVATKIKNQLPPPVRFKVTANYGRSVPLATDAAALQADTGAEDGVLIGKIIEAEKHVPESVECRAYAIDASGNESQKVAEEKIENKIQNTKIEHYLVAGKSRKELNLLTATPAVLLTLKISKAQHARLQQEKPKTWEKFREVTNFTEAQQDELRFNVSFRPVLR